jgi:hypothetical protein
MNHMPEGSEESRRAFFRTVGRSLVLGLTGAGVAAMAQKGRIEVCINELSPCSKCVVLKQGCELPKAMDHRRKMSDGDATPS